MLNLAISRSAAGLLRGLTKRAAVDANRILLTEVHSVDWQSLTFIGERHRIRLRIIGADSGPAAARLADGIEDAEFAIPGQVVADIVVATGPHQEPDGGASLTIEALTIAA